MVLLLSTLLVAAQGPKWFQIENCHAGSGFAGLQVVVSSNRNDEILIEMIAPEGDDQDNLSFRGEYRKGQVLGYAGPNFELIVDRSGERFVLDEEPGSPLYVVGELKWGTQDLAIYCLLDASPDRERE